MILAVVNAVYILIGNDIPLRSRGAVCLEEKMDELNYSKAMKELIFFLRSIPPKVNMYFTAERFMIGVIFVIKQALKVDGGEDTINKLKAEFPENFDFDRAKYRLLEYVGKQVLGSFSDQLYMRKQVDRAYRKTLDEGLEEITPELVLHMIIADPNKIIKECFDPTENSDTDGKQSTEHFVDNIERTIMLHMLAVKLRLYLDQNLTRDENREYTMNIRKDKSRKDIARLTEKAQRIRKSLLEKIFGQDKAVNVFVSGYFQSELHALTDDTKVRPATFLFAGPPGVGKTFLAENAAKVLKLPFARFDMSEYCDKEASLEFCGSDKVYKNGSEGNFTSFVGKNPKCVVLFDEIEKAHISIIHLFLQILDAGRIRDNFTDKEISLKDAILIFTTNAGKQFYENAESVDFSSVPRKVILKALQNDVNPSTGNPYFPAAICSRFASGNVVMFNGLDAHNLTAIAKKEIRRRADSFSSETGVHIKIDENVYTALMYAEGSTVDARTIRSRAGSFLDDELFELLRLVEIKDGADITKIDKIEIGIDLSSSDAETRGFFEPTERPEVLVFASHEISRKCEWDGAECIFHFTDDVETAISHIKNDDVKFILIDMSCGTGNIACEYLNIEDADTVARDVLMHCHDTFPDIPVYILETDGYNFNAEEYISFARQGIRGFVKLNEATFANEINKICAAITAQNNLKELGRANKLISYETSQKISEGGTKANISLFDFKLEVARDAEDSGNILSNMSKPDVKFEDVIGADDAKKELEFFVSYLKNPKKYRGTGVRPPKGVLLYGPPGTGKTLLAKAMASESDVTFITAEGNQFLKQYQGEGAEEVHKLFKAARKYAPAIIFIDEIDAIAKNRSNSDTNSNDSTLTALLTEMDGFKNDPSKPVFVLAATNYAVDPSRPNSIDPAMVRRFDRRIYVDLPNKDDRVRYIRMKTSGNTMYDLSDEKINNLALRSVGKSLADIESVLEMALRIVIRDNLGTVTDEILDNAFESFNNGEENTVDMESMKRCAYHEAGHAFLSWVFGDTPSYATIASRGDYGGYVMHGSENKGIMTKKDLLARICISLGGRAAEMVFYGDEDGISTGASGDLRSATSVAEKLICSYGMDNSLGLGFISPEAIHTGPMALEIRKAVCDTLERELKNAVKKISDNREAVSCFAESLMDKTHMTGEEITKVFEKFSIK